jgi:hypothetical protein
MLVKDKHYSLVDPFVSYAERSVVDTEPGSNIIEPVMTVNYEYF